MNTIIKEIRAGVKRLIDQNAEKPKGNEVESDVYEYALCDVLSIIDEVEKEHPVPADVNEVAEITHDEGVELVDEYLHYLATGLKEGWERPIGPKWMMEFAKKRFLAGAEWRLDKLMKESVEGFVGVHLHDKTADVTVNTAYLPKSMGIKGTDKVRVIIIKREK